MDSPSYSHRNWIVLTVLILLFAPLSIVHAATSPASSAELTTNFITDAYAVPAGVSLCTPDLYQFGSVSAPLSGSLTNVAQGAAIAFTGTLTNQNTYPIIDATVYVKIFKDAGIGKNSNGPDVVDYFPAVSNVTIPAKGSVPYSFTWQTPPNEEPGNYQAATFVVVADRFNLLGLTFTDDVIGNTSDFSVVGQDTGAILFDKTSALVNGNPYYFAAFPPEIPIGQNIIPVSLAVKNTTSVSEPLTVNWSLYDWDASRASNLISQSNESIVAAAGTSTPVTYNLTDTTHTEYELIATFNTTGGAKSVAAFRIGRSGITTPRLNFVGTTAYPAAAGGSAYACFQNEGVGWSPNTKVVVTATRDGVLSLLGPIASATFTGSAAGQPFYALKAPFHTPSSSYVVTAKVYQAGKLIDSVSVPYSCSVLGGSCSIFDTWWPGIVLAAIVIIILIVWYLIRKRRMNHPQKGSKKDSSLF